MTVEELYEAMTQRELDGIVADAERRASGEGYRFGVEVAADKVTRYAKEGELESWWPPALIDALEKVQEMVDEAYLAGYHKGLREQPVDDGSAAWLDGYAAAQAAKGSDE